MDPGRSRSPDGGTWPSRPHLAGPARWGAHGLGGAAPRARARRRRTACPCSPAPLGPKRSKASGVSRCGASGRTTSWPATTRWAGSSPRAWSKATVSLSVVIGSGINLVAPEGLDGAAGVGADVDATDLLGAFLAAFADGYRPEAAGFADDVIARWTRRSATLGRRVAAVDAAGARIEGIAVGLDAHGGLILEHGGRIAPDRDVGRGRASSLTWLPHPAGDGSVRPMAFPRKLLIPGEQLVLELRPHPVALGAGGARHASAR